MKMMLAARHVQWNQTATTAAAAAAAAKPVVFGRQAGRRNHARESSPEQFEVLHPIRSLERG